MSSDRASQQIIDWCPRCGVRKPSDTRFCPNCGLDFAKRPYNLGVVFKGIGLGIWIVLMSRLGIAIAGALGLMGKDGEGTVASLFVVIPIMFLGGWLMAKAMRLR